MQASLATLLSPLSALWVEGTPVGCLRHADDLVGSMQHRRHLQSGHQFLTKDSSTAGLRVTNSGACRPTGTAADGARGPLHACSTVVRSYHRSTRREVSYASGKPKWGNGCVQWTHSTQCATLRHLVLYNEHRGVRGFGSAIQLKGDGHAYVSAATRRPRQCTLHPHRCWQINLTHERILSTKSFHCSVTSLALQL